MGGKEKTMNRGERRRRTEVVRSRRIRQAHSFDHWMLVKYDAKARERWYNKLAGRCRDRSPFDCGKTNCYVCAKKFGGELFPSEVRAEIDFIEQIKESFHE